MSDARPPLARRAGWLLAAALLAGAALDWARIAQTPALAAFVPADGGLTAHQAALDVLVRRAGELAAPEAPALVIAANQDDVAFARHLFYPRAIVEAAVRPRARLEEALGALPDGAPVLVADTDVAFELLRRARLGTGATKLREGAAEGDILLLVVQR